MYKTQLLAMAVKEELEGGTSSLGLSSREINRSSSGQPWDVPSPEDTAWADSLLIEDPEMYENFWTCWKSLKDALSETVSTEHNFLADMLDNSTWLDDFQISPLHESIVSLERSIRSDETVPAIEEADCVSDGLLRNENTNILWPNQKLKNVFRPAYNEDLRGLGTAYEEEGFFLSNLLMDQPPEDIFQVWDLGFTGEGDEWIQQLNEGLHGSSREPSPLASVSSSVLWKDFTGTGMDDMVSGMADLCLDRSVGEFA